MYLGHFLLDCATSPLFLLCLMDGRREDRNSRSDQNTSPILLLFTDIYRNRRRKVLVVLCGPAGINFSECESSQFSPSSRSPLFYQAGLRQQLLHSLLLLPSSPLYLSFCRSCALFLLLNSAWTGR